MKTTFLIVAALFGIGMLGNPCISAEPSQSRSQRIYPFVFKESTDDNLFVISDKAIRPIKGFAPASNASAVKALKSLRANIIYENGDGTKMFLLGVYNSKDAIFTLSAWFIAAPFFAQEIVNEEELPQRLRLELRTALRPSDFSAPVEKPTSFVLQPGDSLLKIRAAQQAGTSALP
jgi:hypothetical protein